MNTKYILAFLILISGLNAYSQNPSEMKGINGIVTRAIIIDGDTIPLIVLPQVQIIARVNFKNKAEAVEWSRLVRNVKRVYPYAKLAGRKINQYNETLQPIKSRRERDRMVKKFQDELFAEFEGELRNLTITQGKILVKLIDRETGNPTYEVIHQYRGGIVAGFWQLTGRIFGYNLKEPYDPNGKDKEIETIVRMIENGLI